MDTPQPTLPERPPLQALEVVVIIHILSWLFAAGVQDHGELCGMYTYKLAAYWLILGLAWLTKATRGRAFRRVVLVTCWMPIAACIY